MIINKAYRYELKPNSTQRVSLVKHAGAARFAYNWALAKRIEMYETEKKATNAIEQHRQLNVLKAVEFPWMYEVSKCAPQEALRDLDQAFSNFFRGLKQKRKTGFPKFKKKGINDSFRLTGTIRVFEKHVQLPRLGKIVLKERPQVEGRILSATLKREADHWYVSISVEAEIEDPKVMDGDAIGLDVGLTCFAALSNGQKIDSPKSLAKHLKRLKRVSKQHSKKAKGSKNRKKSALKLAKLHRTIRNQRLDFLHKFSTKLTKTKSAIVVEDLDVQHMMQKEPLSRQISDASWGTFFKMLEYKTAWYGSKLIKAPKFFASSKICSTCKAQQLKMPLSVRTWQCPHCKEIHDRDINAAKNLVNNYNTESSSGIYACGDPSCGGTGNWSTSYGSLKQELMSGIFVHKL